MVQNFKKYFMYIVAILISQMQQIIAYTGTSRIDGNWSTASTWMLSRTGFLTSSLFSVDLTGTGTSYSTELASGDVLMTSTGLVIGTVSSITDDTHLTLTSNANLVYSGDFTVQKVPASTDNAIISDLTVVTTTEAFSITDLTIGQGFSGILTFSAGADFTGTVNGNLLVKNGASLFFPAGGAAYTLLVVGNTTINSGGVIDATTAGFPATHFLNITGDLTNNGTCTLLGATSKSVELSFVGASNSVVSGTGTWSLYKFTLNKSALAYAVEIQAADFSNAVTPGITLLTQGTFIHNCSGTWDYMDDSRLGLGSSDFTINSNVKIWVQLGTVNLINNGTIATVNPNTSIASGDVQVDGGILNIATGADKSFNICSSNFIVNGGTVNVGGGAGTKGIFIYKPTATTPVFNIGSGTVNVFGSLVQNTSDAASFSMSGGTLTLNVGTSSPTTSTFLIPDVAGSSFTMSNGTIVIQTPGSGTSDFAICGTNGTVDVTGGIIQFGNTNTANSKTFKFTPYSSTSANNVFPNIKLSGTTGNKLIPISASDFRFLSLYINAGNTFDFVNAESNNLTLTGTYDGSNALYIAGNLSPETGTITFGGSTNQAITAIDTTDFYNLTVNNPAGLSLNSPVTVNALLTLSEGIVFSTSTNILTMSSSSSSTSGTSTSYIDGPMDKSGTSAFVFPIGNGTKWARIGIGAPSSNTTFRAQYSASEYSNTTSLANTPTPVLEKVSKKEYWTLDRTVGTGEATVTLFWEDNDFSGINDCSTSDLRIAHWNGTDWENNNNSVTITGTCAGSSSGSISTISAVTSFSPFTFGSLSFSPTINPLPVKLLSFETTINRNSIDINWSTASEINNDFFTIEKTKDGINFELVKVIPGSGNSSSVLNYSAVDTHPIYGISYYRLKQTNFNGTFEYSELKMIDFTKKSTLAIEIHPTPNDGKFNLKITANKCAEILIAVYDFSGNEIFSKAVIAGKEDEVIHTVDLSDQLPSGIYLLNASSQNEVSTKKLIIN